MDKLVELLVSNALGGMGIIVVGWLLTKYVEQVNKNIEDSKTSALERHTSLAARVENIESKYRDVLDIILEKFSRWEDRISGILSKMGTATPEDLQNEIDRFREESVNDIGMLRLQVERVNAEVAKIAAEPADSASRKLILGKLEEVKLELDNRVRTLESNFNKLLRALPAMMNKQREQEQKIETLILTTRTKIKP